MDRQAGNERRKSISLFTHSLDLDLLLCIPRDGKWEYPLLDYAVIDVVRGHSQMTSVERGREGVGQFLTKGREVAWIW